MKKISLSSFQLKIIACVLMTLDHIALLFISGGIEGEYGTLYYVLRAMGKISFPIFAFLAVEGVYNTKNIYKYCLRLFLFAIALDGFGFIIGHITNISIRSNPLIGNAFTDMLLGVLIVYFLKKKNILSILSLLPITYSFFTCYDLGNEWGTLFKSDWGFFSAILFFALFLAKEIASFYFKKQTGLKDFKGNEELTKDVFKYQKIFECIALFSVEMIFYLVYRYSNFTTFIPGEFVPIGTFSVLAFVFYLLYNGKKGYSSKVIQYSFYVYYPFHLIILGIISLFCGVLANYL